MRTSIEKLPSLAIVGSLLITGGPLLAQKAALVPGREEVELYVDEHGLPHLFGSTDEAAFYGLGYQQMLDYPIGTLNMLWLHSGRMAEVAGPSYLDEDQVARLWNVPAIAKRHRVELKKAGLLPYLTAYVRGIEDGRRFWRMNGEPSLSGRLDALLGDDLEVNVDPAPDYLNPAFSPLGDHDDPELPARTRRLVDKLFSAEKPITVGHVLRLGVCINSFFLLRKNDVPRDALPTGSPPPPLPTVPGPLGTLGISFDLQAVKASNGWMASEGGPTGGIQALSDGHLPLNWLQIRPYFLQLEGTDYAATGLTMPGYPGVYTGFNDAITWLFTAPVGKPVAHNRWEATLLPSPDPTDLRFMFELPGGVVDAVRVKRLDGALLYYDPVTDTEGVHPYSRYYVPRHDQESSQLGFHAYPVIPLSADVPIPGATIRFEQAAFTYENSPWEVVLRFGRARNATTDVDEILQSSLLVFGNGNNLMVADRDGNFRYFLMARIPKQGVDVPSSMYDEAAILDGHKLSWRWQDHHDVSSLPSIGPIGTEGRKEVWINTNVSPDLIEPELFTESDLANYPEYMVPHSSVSSWRQLRADELLRGGAAVLPTGYGESVALDLRNTWMHLMWPFYEAARDEVPGGVNADATLLIDWVNQYRSHDENDAPNATHDFEAHEYSQVTVYAVLLRSHYLNELEEYAQTQSLSDSESSFGHEPMHALFDDASSFTYASYPWNIEAMKHALETTAAIWKEGAGASGLVNQSYLASLSPSLPGDPWGDPRYDTDIEPAWVDDIAGTKVTRWGHVNMSSLTPHYLSPPKKKFVDGVPGRGGDKYQFIRGYFFSAVDPPGLDTLVYEHLKIPYFVGQTPRVAPLAGVKTALFLNKNLAVLMPPVPNDYQESVYGWTASKSLDWHPMTTGAQQVFSVRLDANAPARGRFLALLGATEVTKSNLFGDGLLAHQARFGPTQDFLGRTWNDLETRKHLLGTPVFTKKYEPYQIVATKGQPGPPSPPTVPPAPRLR
jgi:hypothetical protein